MSRPWLLFLLCLSLPLLLLVQLGRAHGVLKVNEAATRFSLRDENPQLLLAVENGVGKSFNVVVHVELVDPDGHIKVEGAPHFKLDGGNQKVAITIPLKLADLKWQERSRLLWYRVRYQIESERDAHVEPVSGIISLSEITPELFELRIASSRFVREGMRYRATVRAQHPLTNRPAKDVQIEGTVEFDDHNDETTKLKARAVSNSNGFAVLDFDLPRKINDDDIDLTVRGFRGSVSAREDRSIDLAQQPFIFVSSDKPIYQPGQVVHARVLMFGAAKRALANVAVTLEISDPENESLYRKKLTTSRFGVASADWLIPANSKLGRYEIKFATDDNEEYFGSTSVKISRYDLPNFTVTIKSDRSYYLPEQNAEVEIAATYLFGQPVKRGKVRVVRETERDWNYREQKYETKEGEEYQGETDSSGLYKARIDLQKAQSELDDSDYRRFEDLRYAAYFTDPTTNRTEQRRFDLRITKEAIHVYVIKSDDRYYENSLLPLQFFVSTSYADGSPAQCRVVISDADQEKDGSKRVLRSIKTNRYGLARVKGIEIPPSGTYLQLNFLAGDSRGRIGKHAEGFYVRDEPAIRIETDKSLYRAGEPVEITLTSSERNLAAMLDVSREGVVVHSEVVRLHDRRAVVTLPWTKDLADRLAITAYADVGDDERTMGRRTILFPRNRELKLGIQANHKEYRPGEDALFSFRVRDPQGHSAESALGVVVFDQAVTERARTDEEFGGSYNDSSNDILRLLGEGDAIAGINLKSLNSIDISKPIPADQDLIAEVLLNQGRTYEPYYPYFFGGDGGEKRPAKVFHEVIRAQLKPLREVLQTRYEATRKYPVDETSLRQILSESPVDYSGLRDPWGMPYRVSFFVDKTYDSMTLTSSGADKSFDTSDDFVAETFGWLYFRELGETIDRAVRDYHQRTGGFIRDRQVLGVELMKLGMDLEKLRDRWSQPYRVAFDISTNLYVIRVSSGGANGRFDGDTSDDDFQLWTSSIDYFAEKRQAIDTTLSASLKATHHVPRNEIELRRVLQPAAINLENLRDVWGRLYYSTFQESAFYGDKVKIEMRGNYGGTPKQVVDIKPVTKRILTIALRSSGPDGQEGTSDDFTAGSFGATLSEQGAADPLPRPSEPVTFKGSTGAIKGTVTDPNGAAVAGATVEATREGSTATYETTTDDDGRYLLKNLPTGLYTVRVSASGFQKHEVVQIVVQSSNVVEINATLSVGSVSETVEVTSEGSSINSTSNATMASTVQRVSVLGMARQQVSTPRLREYFPETLVWQPALETDKQGRAQLNFKLADNITTWKMAVIGSTEDGQIGTVERDIKAFQPFFVEHDPPRILTEGDEISLPVVVRNYLERAQSVDLEIKPEGWFTLLGLGRKRAQVPAGDATRETFDFRAQASVTDGKQRILAAAADDSDAIEKPVTVHPDGEEKSTTAGDIVRDDATLMLEIPAGMIPNSAQGELKIYPNLMAHVAESVEAIMRRPYGCGEQTISSTYPSLLLVRNFKQTGQSSPLKVRAEQYLLEGYNRLLNYRDGSGGFTYWGHGEPDLALTAYALRFLSDARGFVPVDEAVIDGARAWLVKQQRADGSWAAFDYGAKLENKRRTVLLTAYVARVLARTSGAAAPKSDKIDSELGRALSYLANRVAEIDEPYLIASYVLAAAEIQSPHALAERARLVSLAHREGTMAYWNLETNTPFYGWGQAGRIESTALVIQALAKGCGSRTSESDARLPVTNSPTETCHRELINRGLLFLLKQKDRYGVWYSSQATINVLDALLAVLAQDAQVTPDSNAQTTAEIIVNGQPVKTIDFPKQGQLVTPISVDISSFLRAGTNRVQIRRAKGAPPASLQALATYYVPWAESTATAESSSRLGTSTGLRLVAKFERTESNVSDAISCHVEAERIGFHGYGMLLAEIGLPPGADVDRASLDEAMKESDWAISQYDILPDRVVVYLWPRVGGVNFNFKFRPRFGLKAKTAASSIYDYYNPEARAVVMPTKFVVKDDRP